MNVSCWLMSAIEGDKDIYLIAREVEDAATMPERWKAIRKLYEVMTPRIMDGEKFDPYFVDWTKLLSPIEMDAWCCLRQSNIVLYPQYPVWNYFVDFADPIQKIGIEMDGRAFHDKTKDSIRDARLKNLGWKIYRIAGYEAVNSFDLYDAIGELSDCVLDDNEIIDLIDTWLFGTVEGIVRAVQFYHYEGGLPYGGHVSEWCYERSVEKVRKCLSEHTYQ